MSMPGPAVQYHTSSEFQSILDQAYIHSRSIRSDRRRWWWRSSRKAIHRSFREGRALLRVRKNYDRKVLGLRLQTAWPFLPVFLLSLQTFLPEIMILLLINFIQAWSFCRSYNQKERTVFWADLYLSSLQLYPLIFDSLERLVHYKPGTSTASDKARLSALHGYRRSCSKYYDAVADGLFRQPMQVIISAGDARHCNWRQRGMIKCLTVHSSYHALFLSIILATYSCAIGPRFTISTANRDLQGLFIKVAPGNSDRLEGIKRDAFLAAIRHSITVVYLLAIWKKLFAVFCLLLRWSSRQFTAGIIMW